MSTLPTAATQYAYDSFSLVPSSHRLITLVIDHGEPADDRVDLVVNLFIALELDCIGKRGRSISLKLTLRGLCGVYANCGLALPKGVIF